MNTWPYTNFHELNLDWILSQLKEQDAKLANYIRNNSITYADPIQWDITNQYPANTVVVDKDGNAYLSVAVVPAGINITNTDYWSEIGNFSAIWGDVKNAITAYDDGATAPAARKKYDYVWTADKLVQCTQDIAAGTKYIIGANCKAITISDDLQTIRALVTAERQARENADTALQEDIIAEQKARISADNALQNKIDAIHAVAINAADYGITESTADIAPTLNKIMTDNPLAYVVLPAGNYTAKTTIVPACRGLYILGKVTSTASSIISVAANNIDLYAYSLVGNGSNTGMLIEGRAEVGTGQDTIRVDYIDNVNIAFNLQDSSGGGVLRNKIYFNYITNCNVGVNLSASSSVSFVNQNYFEGGGIEATTCAISMSGSQTDPFNGNIFENISFENSAQALNISNAQGNHFGHIRLYENTADNSIVFAADTKYNVVSGGYAVLWKDTMISDKGNNFYEHIQLHDVYNGVDKVISYGFRTMGQVPIATDPDYMESKVINNFNPPSYGIITNLRVENKTVILPASQSFGATSNMFVLEVGAASTETGILAFNGTKIATTTDGGSSGVQLNANSKYLVINGKVFAI